MPTHCEELLHGVQSAKGLNGMRGNMDESSKSEGRSARLKEFHRVVRDIHERNADTDSFELQRNIDQAVREVRNIQGSRGVKQERGN